MAPASLQIVCMEPIVFLRGQSAVGEDARGRRRPINFDAPPSQLRGLLTMTLPRPSRVKEISITLHGRARTDWPEGIGPNRLDTVEESTIFKQKVVLYDAKDVPQAEVQGRPRSSSIGPGTIGTQDDGDWEISSAAVTPPSAAHQKSANTSRPSSSRNSQDRIHGEERKNSNIAKAIGKTAVKAGSAILPPTLIRELQASRQNGQMNNTFNGSKRSPVTSPLVSPTASRASPLQMQRGMSEQRTRQGYFDPPPVYNPDVIHGSLRPQSVSSVESEHQPRGTNVPLTELSTDAGEFSSGQPASLDAPVPHPQSNSAAGPGQRSILHSERRPKGEGAARARDGIHEPASPVTVRFDPPSVAESSDTPLSSILHATPPSAHSTPLSTSHQSAPTREMSTLGVGSTHSSPGATRSSSVSQTGANYKGKGRMPPSISSGSSNPKKSLKGILGTLLKEDDERQRDKAEQKSLHLEEDEGHIDWREFKKGTYTYPFSIPLPSNLPPTLHADFGSNAYVIRGHAHRAGPLTSNLTAEKEVTLVHAPDEDGQDDMESIVVERNWEDALRYMVVVMGKSFPVGGVIPVWAKFVPTEKVRIHRIIASLEERTAYYAKSRKVARHEVPRRWTLLRVLPANADEGILPIISEASDALESSSVTKYARHAQTLYSGDSEEAVSEAVASLMDPTGPWELAMDLEVPKAAKTRINISSNHNKSNIAVHHIVKIAIRVERLEGSGNEKQSSNGKSPESQRKLYDILIDAPIAVNHSQTANIWLSLPDYWSVAQIEDSPSRGATSIAAQGQHDLRRDADAVRGQQTLRSQGEASGSTRNQANSTNDEANNTSRNTQLVQLGRTWLSLSGAGSFGREENGAEIHLPGSAENLPPFAPSSRATVTYSEFSVHDGVDDAGLPTYAMIDNERGSVDPPPSRRGVIAK